MNSLTIMTLIQALILVESNNNDRAVGDDGLAYGCLQIHKIYVEDVNRILGEDKYVHVDAFDRHDSIDMFITYTSHYATYTRLGREPTPEDFVRIHNGGPNGWKKPATKKHWNKVKDILDNYAKRPFSNPPQRKTSTRLTSSDAAKK
jgi:hypothetical protein